MDAVGADLTLPPRAIAFDLATPAVVTSPVFLAFLGWRLFERLGEVWIGGGPEDQAVFR